MGLVTKIDERAFVPAVGAAEIAKLVAVLDRAGVVAASLFGSQADGRAGPLSDIDVAVWLEPGLGTQARFHLGLALSAAAARALATDEVDLVVLNDVPPLLAHRVMSRRMMILERDRVGRVRLETQALLQYLDTAPLRKLADQTLRRRFETGSFGRP